ncbi:MAG: bifunctional (p)ppGpp synthetase/guanosine-3',5'-bis(diphosphate) 3'-pyrophosphohydrolase [Candidatus Gastranaerophilales bacterium]|nr:bifunctional (p)ppGpp synthetase/guanosine-3',5'-bis(diphosphate) 3'-pyrophosphohydrolase [Candidatus Gastranaerophilales bacterium]
MSSTFEPLEIILKKQGRKQEDIVKIKEAFDFAYSKHDGQYRASEEPYIIHPVEVAKILAEFKADTPTIMAALLHDVLEDTEVEPDEIENKFGADVLKLVNGVTKLGKLEFKSKEDRQAENFRKLFISMAEDVRVILLKLADRLHNMRTLNHMPLQKQKRIAQETLEVFAPLANRLGIGRIKAELEDLSLRYTEPEKYYEVVKNVAQTKAERDEVVQTLVDTIQTSLTKAGIKATIKGRAKHYYSIYAKMKRQQKDYHELFDIIAVRVIVDNLKDCYGVLGLIHSTFKPIPGRFKDYIAMPKSNLYRSLHTSVIGPKGKPVEIQIRTQQMHEEAEYGIAAHWKYKESGSVKTTDADKKFTWLRKLAEVDENVKDAKEYVNFVKLDLFSDQVFVFTPMGDVFDLPSGATPIDFAYRVHTEVGHKMVGAKINGRIVPLETHLFTGDIIEIITSKIPNPKWDWLNIAVTNNAKSKIKLWFKKNKRDEYIVIGRETLERALTKARFDEYEKIEEFERIAKELNYTSQDDLFAAIGYGETSAHKVINKLPKLAKSDDVVKIQAKTTKNGKKDIVGLEGMLYHISKCCMPIPGEPIVGAITRSRGVSVHRVDCPTLNEIPQERLMAISWANVETKKTYVVPIKIEIEDKVGIFQAILSKVTDNKTNIAYASGFGGHAKRGIIELGLEVKNIDELNKIMNSIQAIPEVISMKRTHAPQNLKKNQR